MQMTNTSINIYMRQFMTVYACCELVNTFEKTSTFYIMHGICAVVVAM